MICLFRSCPHLRAKLVFCAIEFLQANDAGRPIQKNRRQDEGTAQFGDNMIGAVPFSKEDMHRIGIRFHTARVLTGLKRDDFSTQHNLARLSIKNWEAGLAIPRHEGIVAAITALKDSGVFASREWLLYGLGNGPNYYQAQQYEQARSNDSFINEQIALFKKACRAQEHEPIVVVVKDDGMLPFLCRGDYVGGVIVSPELVKSALATSRFHKRPWLVSCNGEVFAPAFIHCHADKWFMSSAINSELKEIVTPNFARIKWHYEIDS